MSLSRRSFLFASAVSALAVVTRGAEAKGKKKQNLAAPLPTAIGALIVADLVAKQATRKRRTHRLSVRLFRKALQRAEQQLRRAARVNRRQRATIEALANELHSIATSWSKARTPMVSRLRRAAQKLVKLRTRAVATAGPNMASVAAKGNAIGLHALVGETGSRAAGWVRAVVPGAIVGPKALVGEDGIVAPSDLNGARGLVSRVAKSLRNTPAASAAGRLNAARARWARAGKNKAQVLGGIHETAVANVAALEGL